MGAVGIDLGTTHSLISVFEEDGTIELIPNSAGGVLTPSVVGLSDKNELLVGSAAVGRLISNPKQTFAMFKRNMGTEKPYVLGKQSYSANELSAMVLRKLKVDLEH